MNVFVSKEFEFDSCHNLPNHNGLCKSMHGHTYTMIVTLSGEICDIKDSPEYGMILDFKELKSIVNEKVINHLDHSVLNDSFTYPTAEIMAGAIFKNLKEEINILSVKKKRNIKLEKIKLYEGKGSYCTVKESNYD